MSAWLTQPIVVPMWLWGALILFSVANGIIRFADYLLWERPLKQCSERAKKTGRATCKIQNKTVTIIRKI